MVGDSTSISAVAGRALGRALIGCQEGEWGPCWWKEFFKIDIHTLSDLAEGPAGWR